MYNLIISASGEIEDIGLNRMLEFTDPKIQEQFKTTEGAIDFAKLEKLPTLLVKEFDSESDAPVYVGYLDPNNPNEILQSDQFPTFPARLLYQFRPRFGINSDSWEHSRTHWAVKNIDLFSTVREVLKVMQVNQKPTYSTGSDDTLITSSDKLDNDSIAIMMPFTGYDDTLAVIRRVCSNAGFHAKRVDDDYGPASIPDEIHKLIRNSAYVIADMSGLNANVCYEVGYAAALNKPTILITSTPSGKTPFDIAHMRRLEYLKNGEGLKELEENLIKAVDSLKTSH